MANTTGGDKIFTTPWTTDRMLKIPAAIPASSTTFYAGQAVGRNASGNMVQMDDTAKSEFLGILQDLVRTTVDTTDAVQTNGLLGDKMFMIEQPQLYTALIASAAAGDEGRKVFWLYNNQVSYTPGTNANFAGWVWFVRDSTHVTILPPWMSHVTAGGNKGQYTTAATGTVTLTKWDINKDILMPLTAGTTINLPAANSVGPGDSMTFINLSSNTSVPTLTAAGADTINGAATLAMSSVQYASLTLRSNGVSAWYSAAQNVSGTLGATTFSGNVGVSATLTVTDNVANSLAVGPNGATNPSFTVDTSTASAATGLNVKSAAAAAGLAVSVISSGTNENLTLDAKGSGTVTINGTATGAVALGANTTVAGTLTGTSTTRLGPDGRRQRRDQPGPEGRCVDRQRRHWPEHQGQRGRLRYRRGRHQLGHERKSQDRRQGVGHRHARQRLDRQRRHRPWRHDRPGRHTDVRRPHYLRPPGRHERPADLLRLWRPVDLGRGQGLSLPAL